MSRIPSQFAAAARAVAALITAAVVATALTGCQHRLPHEEAIIAGVRANSTVIPPQNITDALVGITENGDRVRVISADGKPKVVLDLTLQEVPTNADDKAAYLQLLRTRVGTAVDDARAVAAESDPLAAVGLAGRGFGQAEAFKRVDVLDSMVGTTGLLSMQHGGLYLDPKDRVAAVEDQKELPSLEGVTVRAPLFGVVTASQTELDSAAFAGLRAQWLAVLRAAKAKVSLEPSSTAPQEQPGKTLPTVTPVPVRRPEPPVIAGCTQSLPDNVLGFQEDEAVLLDEPAAREAVARIAEALRDCPGTIHADGYTSSAGTDQVDLRLSRSRASLVAEMVAAALDIGPATITVTGHGKQGPCRVVDRDAQGRLVEALAASNRKTIVTRSMGSAPTPCP